jgi:hypothetical protein
MNPVKAQLPALFPHENYRVILSSSEVDSDLRARVPDLWLALLEAESRAQIRDLLKALWEPVYDALFHLMRGRRAIVPICLQGFAILLDNGVRSLLYLFTSEGQVEFYRGNLPLDEANLPEQWKRMWPALPDHFRALYRVHNGWFSAWPGQESGYLGHLPVQKWWRVGEEIPGLDLPYDDNITLANVVITFETTGGDRMGFEVYEREDGSIGAVDVLWLKGDPPCWTNFVDKYDQWIAESYFTWTVDESTLPPE